MIVWTRESPSEPGFYYWQGGKLSGKQVAIVQVTAFKDKTKPLEACELRAESFANAPGKGAASKWGGLWSGPLPQPF